MKKDAQKMLFLFTAFSFLALNLLVSAESSTINPECQDSCGGVQIPYPFGIGPGCYLDDGIAVSCNKSGNDPADKPFVTSANMEILEIFADQSNFRVNYPVLFSNCGTKNNSETVMDLFLTPFSISDKENQFTAMGCDNLALLKDNNTIYGGCLSICLEVVGVNASTDTGTDLRSCNGINCCQTSTPPLLNRIGVSMRSANATREHLNSQCRYSFMVEKAWFNTNNVDPVINNTDFVPAILVWGVEGDNCTNICGRNAGCSSVVGVYGGVCKCKDGYEGNPYLPTGCQGYRVDCSFAIHDYNSYYNSLGIIDGKFLLHFSTV